MLYLLLWFFFSWVTHRLWLAKGRRYGFLIAVLLSPIVALAIGTILDTKREEQKGFPNWVIDIPAVCLPVCSFFIIAGSITSLFTAVNMHHAYEEVTAESIFAIALAFCPTVFGRAVRGWIENQQNRTPALPATLVASAPSTPGGGEFRW